MFVPSPESKLRGSPTSNLIFNVTSMAYLVFFPAAAIAWLIPARNRLLPLRQRLIQMSGAVILQLLYHSVRSHLSGREPFTVMPSACTLFNLYRSIYCIAVCCSRFCCMNDSAVTLLYLKTTPLN